MINLSFIEHAGPFCVVHLQVPFMGAPEVERRELVGVGHLVQYSISRSPVASYVIASS
jgi:hypothetical protein